MSIFKCKYCGKECKNKNSLTQHELRCKKNPNKLKSGIEFYNESTHDVWNKGLTKETDARVLKQSITIKNRYKNGDILPYFLGKKHSNESKKKLSESMKKYLKENPDKVPYLRNHSSKMSYPEEYFIEVFKKENIDLKYHLQVGLYELDFYNKTVKKYVEIDGSQHYLPESIIRDEKRTEYLNSLGWKGIRICWSQYQKMTFDEKKKIIEEIKYFLNN